MTLFSELNQEIRTGSIDTFSEFLNKKLQSDKLFLQRTFWVETGEQMTVLYYLIHLHDQQQCDLSKHIELLLKQGACINTNQPVHFAVQKRKLDLIPFFLNDFYVEELAERSKGKGKKESEQALQIDSPDMGGRTLLSRVIDAGDEGLLHLLLSCCPNIHQPSQIKINDEVMIMQPLHQAVVMGFADAVKSLIDAGAQADNPCGLLQETPLLLAARMGQVDALEVLLESTNGQLDLEGTNAESDRAIDLLCVRLHDQQKPQDALRGIAMLLCHGATVPRHELLRDLLTDNRKTLLSEVKKYAAKDPILAAKFIRACHDKNSDLHNIIYAKHSWTQSIRHLFGIAGEEAFTLESLVAQDKEPSASSVSYTKDEVLFAEFVKRYDASIKGHTIFNPWSAMRWKITTGEITSMKQVREYAAEYPNTRTDKILKEMENPRLSFHEDLEQELADNSCNPLQ